MTSFDTSFLLFDLGFQKYSLPFQVVDEILPAAELLPVPNAHTAMEGLIDVRGDLLPVFSLSSLLKLQRHPICYTDHLLILRIDKTRFAIQVDRACQLADFSECRSPSSRKVPFCGNIVARVDRYKGEQVITLEPKVLSQMLEEMCCSSVVSNGIGC